MLIKNLFKFWTFQVFSPGTLVKDKYEAFKSLLAQDACAHETMAELEAIFYNRTRVDLPAVTKRYDRLSASVSSMVESLLKMHPSRYANLDTYYRKFDAYVRFLLEPVKVNTAPPFAIRVDEIPLDALYLVGTKALNLSRINRELGLPVPRGFVVTTNAFHCFLHHNRLNREINETLAQLDIHCPHLLTKSARKLTGLIMEATVPNGVASAINQALAALEHPHNSPLTLAVRSSCVGEDTIASFAGQYQTLLHVNEAEVVHAYKQVIASKYSAQALFYRISRGILDHATPMGVMVLEMVKAMASGIAYTRSIDPPDDDTLSIHAVPGLGDTLMGGEVSPDCLILVKRDSSGSISEFHANLEKRLIDRQAITTLAGWAGVLENCFGSPQDMEWAMDKARRLFILQSRPLNLAPHTPTAAPPATAGTIRNPVLIRGGDTAAPGRGSGPVFQAIQPFDFHDLPKGAVLVSRSASPYLVVALERANAIVTDLGSSSGHLATVAREFNTPTLVNTGNATSALTQGDRVSVDADNRVVYQGEVASGPSPEPTGLDDFEKPPFIETLGNIMEFISPLSLVDPASPMFTPEGCRSMHDIIRFAHETAIQEMFALGARKGGRRKGARRLVSGLPMLFYLLDMGGGIKETVTDPKEVTLADITSLPLESLLNGLNHPGIRWSHITHFDWESHDRIVMAGGIINADAPQFGSYAVFSSDYLNLNLRFGYHFVILDTLCTSIPTDNHILFRFSGGGGDALARTTRAGFIGGILKRLDFAVHAKADLVDARFQMGELPELTKRLELIGRLLGTTRLMDLYLNGHADVEDLVDDFMNGRYDFSSTQG